MAQFGEVIHCHKPPYSGIPGEDFVNVRFATQEAADRAYAALKGGQVFVDGFPVGIGPVSGNKSEGGGGHLAIGNGPPPRRRSPSPPRRYGRNRQRSPVASRRSPRRSPPRRRQPSPEPMPLRGNFPSRNDPKSPSPRRLARDMNLTAHSRSRSRARERRHREERSEFSGGGLGLGGLRVKDKPARSPSPDPPGPVRNLNPVKNPFFRPGRSPSPDSDAG